MTTAGPRRRIAPAGGLDRTKLGPRKRLPPKTQNHLVLAVLKAIEESGMHDKDVALQAGLEKNTISLWRAGKTNPKASQLEWVLIVIGARAKVEFVTSAQIEERN